MAYTPGSGVYYAGSYDAVGPAAPAAAPYATQAYPQSYAQPVQQRPKRNTSPKARIAAALLVIAIILCIISHFLMWSKPSNGDGGLGLWRVCTSVGYGSEHCSNIQGAEPWLKVVRAFMIAAPILMLLAIIFMVLDSPPFYILAQLSTSCAFGLLAFAVFYYPYREWKISKDNQVDAGWILALIGEFFCIVGSIVLFVATTDGFAPPGSAKRYQTVPEKTPPPTYAAQPKPDPAASYASSSSYSYGAPAPVANPLTAGAAAAPAETGYVTPPQTYVEDGTAFPAPQFNTQPGGYGGAYYE
eukprot:TRINITY_DN2832_c0_g1_i1.p1 TRINITY_DN2832_c0_g1~~TRINITY_DN2832_c0_g1_i1.p1  ORF type:complete len:330 (+),score=36.03 TRINITY_DN2832_c0_g1_i1:93-992(+)